MLLHVWMKWIQENRMRWKSVSGRGNVKFAKNNRNLNRMIVTDHTEPSGQVTKCWSNYYRCLIICFSADCVQEFFCVGFTSCKNMGTCGHNGEVEMDIVIQMDNNLSFWRSNTDLTTFSLNADRWMPSAIVCHPNWYCTKAKHNVLRRFPVLWTIATIKNFT